MKVLITTPDRSSDRGEVLFSSLVAMYPLNRDGIAPQRARDQCKAATSEVQDV
jgi:hypothetical protein